MFSQFVFVLKIKIKRAFPLLVHMRFLFSLSLPWDTFRSHDKNFGGRRHWAAALKSGHAVQRKRCGSLNRSFSYWEAARSLRPPLPTFPGTSQATGGSLQALIGGVPVPSRIQLFQRNCVAKMEWVPRRPLGRAFSSKILGMTVKS